MIMEIMKVHNFSFFSVDIRGVEALTAERKTVNITRGNDSDNFISQFPQKSYEIKSRFRFKIDRIYNKKSKFF